MSIEDFISKVCVQTAVYWGIPVPDGYGNWTFDNPKEINCRWQGSNKLITANNGEQVVAVAEILVTQDLDNEGYLFLGCLEDLNAADITNPKKVGAHKIKQISKVPMVFSTTVFVRTVYI